MTYIYIQRVSKGLESIRQCFGLKFLDFFLLIRILFVCTHMHVYSTTCRVSRKDVRTSARACVLSIFIFYSNVISVKRPF